jgi:hypothetical protein
MSVRCLQIGFLTEWQLYAQKVEGDSWAGEKIDEGKLQKMSGKFLQFTSRAPRAAVAWTYVLLMLMLIL